MIYFVGSMIALYGVLMLFRCQDSKPTQKKSQTKPWTTGCPQGPIRNGFPMKGRTLKYPSK